MEGTVRQRAAGRTDLIDIAALGIRFPWLYEREQDCIVSPDADGLLCGLLMSHHLGWRIRGFYDAKVLVCSSAVRPQNCVFLDMEIFRPNVRSVGQHLLMYNRNRIPPNWDHFESAFAINEVRGIDARTFDQKYPFGTIHFLMVALHSRLRLEVPDGAIAPLLFVDGTYHNLFRYTENSLDWLRYLRVRDSANPLQRLFMHGRHSIHALMSRMDAFWEARDRLSVKRERGDRVAITLRGGQGTPHNLCPRGGLYDFDLAARSRAESFLALLADATGWRYLPSLWEWQGWHLWCFETGVLERATIPKFSNLVAKRPLSLAMRVKNCYDFTLPTQDPFR